MTANDIMTATYRDDCSVITVECTPTEYSASRLAHAVEDSNAQLVDLLTSPGPGEHITVTLRVGHNDPSATVRSLERYDYRVVEAKGVANSRDAEVATERLLSLKALLDV